MPERPQLPATILALDLGSLRTGWALARLDNAGRVVQRQSGVLLLEDVSAVRWKRIDHFAKWLSAICKQHGVTYLACEEAFPGAHPVIHGLVQLVDLASGRLFGRPVYPVSRSAVYIATVGWNRRQGTKIVGGKAVTTTRCPSKAEVRSAINARHAAAQGRRINSEDEADAIGVLDTLLAELAGTGMRALPVVAPPRVIKLPLLGGKPAGSVRARGRRPAA
jgi:Holliday junction resolvasome RuvABC endonuclease subunit